MDRNRFQPLTQISSTLVLGLVLLVAEHFLGVFDAWGNHIMLSLVAGSILTWTLIAVTAGYWTMRPMWLTWIVPATTLPRDAAALQSVLQEDTKHLAGRVFVDDRVQIREVFDSADKCIEFTVRLTNATLFKIQPQAFDEGTVLIGGRCARVAEFVEPIELVRPLEHGQQGTYTIRQWLTRAHVESIQGARQANKIEPIMLPTMRFVASFDAHKHLLRLPLPSIRLASEATAKLIYSKWWLVFSPSRGHKKAIEFADDGKVTEGSNNNEYSWELNGEILILRRVDQRIQNRFRWDNRTQSWKSTNDNDTDAVRRGYMDQYIIRCDD